MSLRLSEVVLITHEAMQQHDPGPGHPERPDRLRAIVDLLHNSPVAGSKLIAAKLAQRKWIERVHDRSYVDLIDSLRGGRAQLDPDTFVSPGSVDAAYLAAGAAVQAVEAVCSSASSDAAGANSAVAIVRPPGHHALRDRAMGFCLFNNIAIAAQHAISDLGITRVLIVDWDVHHGNGTQIMFEDRRDVLVFTAQQWPHWPGTGATSEVGRGEGEGFTVNCPLPAGFDDAGYVSLFRRVLRPIADAYQPELVLVSAGFDAHRNDPLAGMRVTEAGFAAMCGIVRDIAHEHANGRLALILEGGYDLNALASSLRVCIEVLAGGACVEIGEPDERSAQVIDQLCELHRRYWPTIV